MYKEPDLPQTFYWIGLTLVRSNPGNYWLTVLAQIPEKSGA